MPLIAFAPPRTKVAQFIHTFTLGGRYLQPTSRAMALCVAALLYLSWGKSSQYILYALALAVLLFTAPYEIYFIFPINDRVEELGKKMDKMDADDGEGNGAEGEIARIDKELRALIAKWGNRNFGRAGPCLVAAVLVGIAGMLGAYQRSWIGAERAT